MVEISQSSVKSVSHLPTKIDVVEFDDADNFEKWRCEVMDALTTSNLEDSLGLEEKLELTSEKDLDQINQMACGVIR